MKPVKRIRNAKRILSVQIERMVDDSPDTSYLGEYSNHATSKFSIDRAHSEDCASIESRAAVEKLERVISYLDAIRTSPEVADNPDSTEWESLDEAIELCIGLQDDCAACDCGGHCVSSRELPYFNPSFNYVTKDDKPADGLTVEDVRKYVRQDYDRMESLNTGNWCYLGIRAKAEIQTGSGVVQRISSGGLWGIESDSDRDYLESVEAGELSALRAELKAIGFPTRAISKAFKSLNAA